MPGKSRTSEAEAARSQRAEDAKKAMSDYEAEAAAVNAKTARLRALRLARDAALPPKAPDVPKKKTKISATLKKGSAPSLAEWLDTQDKEGRPS
jgi:hypothetical protein